ncbi:arylamine N-acetyltransferase [Streptomyces sp. ID05-04B]|uniref:arylamine N-acetyltransferase family protein n=1 Tax=unclassified Streptomyces TaxID=2593676 RepID=UPI000D19BD9F|nr:MULTISPECIES: arylamine N-acetyltransferase [unclassified Streptomyces]AVV42652.1 acetyltransferase [Streptomyces sp. P3]MDX5562968.1 arylamine N-acetyltransferase [Streptomyces sp. ID05-04B]
MNPAQSKDEPLRPSVPRDTARPSDVRHQDVRFPDARLVAAYLHRLGLEPPLPPPPTAGVLRDLHLRHLRSVPFENLSVHRGEGIVLEERRLVEKVVEARRGGFCYELNGAFGALLTALGFEVTLLAARVYGEEGRLGIPYDHLALLVRTVDGGQWLADVGFGAHSHHPLRWGQDDEQTDPGGTFRIVGAGPDPAGAQAAAGGTVQARDMDVVRDGARVYRLEVRPRVLGDFAAGAWWHSTSPESHFTRSLICSRLTEDGGRITLSGRRFKTTSADGTIGEHELEADDEVLEVYRERFGIELERVPAVRAHG